MHFTSKEHLFLAAVPGTRDLAAKVAGDPEPLPERVASSFVNRMEAADGAEPFIALIRSAAGDQQAATRLLAAMQEHCRAAYRSALRAPNADRRVALVGAQPHRRHIQPLCPAGRTARRDAGTGSHRLHDLQPAHDPFG